MNQINNKRTKKAQHASLAQQNGFGLAFFRQDSEAGTWHSKMVLVQHLQQGAKVGTAKRNTSC